MPKSWQMIDRALKGQRAGMRILLQHAGVATVKYRYQGEYISADLLDAAGRPRGGVTAQQADSLRHIAVSQLNANPGGAELWRRSAGTLEWILSGDVTISRRNYPGSDHDLEMGRDLRDVAGLGTDPAEDQTEAERPRMYA